MYLLDCTYLSSVKSFENLMGDGEEILGNQKDFSCGVIFLLVLAHLGRFFFIPCYRNNTVSDAGEEGFSELPSISILRRNSMRVTGFWQSPQPCPNKLTLSSKLMPLTCVESMCCLSSWLCATVNVWVLVRKMCESVEQSDIGQDFSLDWSEVSLPFAYKQ